MKIDLTKPINELVEIYLAAKKTYYDSANPIMSDQEFDELEQHLIDQDALPDLVGFDDDSTEDTQKVKHVEKLLSLRKMQLMQRGLTKEQAEELWSKYGKGRLSFKYDGLAAELRYSNGILKSVATRGNGFYGRSIIDKVRDLVPNEINSKENIGIRVEICIPQSVFNEKYSKEYSHARNLAAGIIRDENVNDNRKYDLKFIALEAVGPGGTLLEPQTLHEYFSENYKTYYDVNSVDELIKIFDYVEDRRLTLDYPTDGMVYTSTSAETFEHNGKYPDYAQSIKFMPPVSVSTITEIKWKLQKTGRYTPIIHFEPIYIDGRKISSASGHNIDVLVEGNFVKGEKVQIVLSNDIIPMVKKLNK